MAGIGSFTFIQVDGPPLPALAENVERIERQGIDGQAYRATSRKTEPFQWTTTAAITSLANADTLISSYYSVRGSLAVCVDDFGRTVSNVMIRDVRPNRLIPVLNSAPVGTAYLVQCVWLLEPTQ
ncbi:MAG: hypothetical protein JXA82_18095 [Sedimentisphaerales bacterium]|nr:hypothetical protein [Sedimentisphaerales bacterium]